MLLNRWVFDFSEKPISFPEPRGLEVLSLRGCSEWVTDEVLGTLVVGGQLTEVYLFRCTRLTDRGVINLVRNCGKALRNIELSGCIKISDESLKAIGRYCKVVQSLDLTRCPLITDVGINFILDECSKRLEVLLLYADSGLGPSTYLGISEAHNLKKLDLCGHHNLSSSELIRIITNCENLVYLNLSWCTNISDEAIQAILEMKKLKHVEYLSLHGIKSLSRDVAIGLIEYLKGISSLTSLDLRGIPSVSDYTIDECLKLRETISSLVEWKLHH